MVTCRQYGIIITMTVEVLSNKLWLGLCSSFEIFNRVITYLISGKVAKKEKFKTLFIYDLNLSLWNQTG